MSGPAVVIAVPCQDLMYAFSAYDLAKMMAATASLRPDIALRLAFVTGCYVPQQRETLADAALSTDATHILYVDSDMRYPKDTLVRLLAHEHPIVGANYTTRRAPFVPIAVRDLESGDRVYTTEQSTGLEAVQALGCGVMLIATAVLRQLKKPRFMLGYIPENAEYVGEDTYFCQMARAIGVPILVDHDLSKDVSHLGTFEFTPLHARPTMLTT